MQESKGIGSDALRPASLAGMKLKNRIIRSATEEGYGDAEGRPGPKLGDFYARMAKGGAGAIITGLRGVSPESRASKRQSMIHRDEFIEDYREIAAKVHEHGTPIIMQLAHAGRQTTREAAGGTPVAPSPIKDKVFRVRPRELSGQDIEQVVSDFAAAAVRAREAGFDGIQIHAAHGYLLSQFLSAHMNRRTDRFGGSLENRFRIVARIFEETRKRVGGFPILAKINASDTRKKGMRPGEALRVAQLLEKAGCDAVEVSCGVAEDGFNTARLTRAPVPAMMAWVDELAGQPRLVKKFLAAVLPFLVATPKPLEDYNVADAALIKKSVGIPVIVVGGIHRLADIETILAGGSADFVAMARPFIVEPGIVNKFASGKSAESRCIKCGYCLLGVNSGPLRCYYGRIPKAA